MNRFEPDGLAFISGDQDEAMSGSRVLPRDVLLNITGASIGVVVCCSPGVLPRQRKPARERHPMHGGNGSRYLVFYVARQDFQKFILDSERGVTRQALTKQQIEGFRIAAPALPEQHRIATILKAQLAAVERARPRPKPNSKPPKPCSGLRSRFKVGECRYDANDGRMC